MNPANEQKPRLLVIAGPNGTGKTTVTKRGLAHAGFAVYQYINPAFIACDKFCDWNSPDAILNAAQLASQLREDCLAHGQSMAFETVFSAPDIPEVLETHRNAYQGLANENFLWERRPSRDEGVAPTATLA